MKFKKGGLEAMSVRVSAVRLGFNFFCFLFSVIQFNFLNVFDAYVFIFFKHQNF